MPLVTSVSVQPLQQHLSLLQVLGVKSLGKPVVDLGQHLVRLFLLALVLPEAGKARHDPQLPRFRGLLAGNLDSLEKIPLCRPRYLP
jgi:hypothetical protein